MIAKTKEIYTHPNQQHRNKYISKNHIGFLKMIKRQENKPTYKKVIVFPVVLTYSKKHGKYKPLKKRFYNSIFNGMNLKELFSRESKETASYTGMYCKANINKNGKYILSRHGADLLRKKRLKKQNHETNKI